MDRLYTSESAVCRRQILTCKTDLTLKGLMCNQPEPLQTSAYDCVVADKIKIDNGRTQELVLYQCYTVAAYCVVMGSIFRKNLTYF